MAPTTTRGTGLASRLRDGTRDAHADAEGTPFIGAMFAGTLPRAAYVDLLVQYRLVYEALESAGRRLAGEPGAHSLLDPALERVPALESDLHALAGEAWRDVAHRGPALEYAAEVTAAGRTVAGYAAHAYTRYLGDLSGGRAVGAVLSRRYGWPDDVLGFYAFPGIADVKPYKDRYRAALDALPLDEAAQREVVGHSVTAFRLNAALLRELGDAHGVTAP